MSSSHISKEYKKLQISSIPKCQQRKNKKGGGISEKKSQQATLSTLGSRNSTQNRGKKITENLIEVKKKSSFKRNKGEKKKRPQLLSNFS